MNFYVGTSGYAYKEWKGSFYPEKFPDKQMLSYYSERFRSVEINNTFYKPPTASVLEAWVAEVPADFRFVLKAPQEITHRKRLVGVEEMVSSFIDTAECLKERLGPLLFQLPPNYKKNMERLSAFLPLVAKQCRVTFEFRHPSWFDDEVFGLLREHNVALCIADADDDLEVPFEATADWGYSRLRRVEYSNSALKTWATNMQKQNWSDCFVFFKHEDTGTGPKFATQFLEAIAKGSKPAMKKKPAK
jgi:uncharacterized protein YecE (DUF72 family)